MFYKYSTGKNSCKYFANFKNYDDEPMFSFIK